MGEMKGDMAGGAAVMAAIGAIAQLKPEINVTAVVPAAENLPSSNWFAVFYNPPPVPLRLTVEYPPYWNWELDLIRNSPADKTSTSTVPSSASPTSK